MRVPATKFLVVIASHVIAIATVVIATIAMIVSQPVTNRVAQVLRCRRDCCAIRTNGSVPFSKSLVACIVPF